MNKSVQVLTKDFNYRVIMQGESFSCEVAHWRKDSFYLLYKLPESSFPRNTYRRKSDSGG